MGHHTSHLFRRNPITLSVWPHIWLAYHIMFRGAHNVRSWGNCWNCRVISYPASHLTWFWSRAWLKVDLPESWNFFILNILTLGRHWLYIILHIFYFYCILSWTILGRNAHRVKVHRVANLCSCYIILCLNFSLARGKGTSPNLYL